jgi:hypothetical protein
VARAPLDRLADELAALLSETDAALRARFRESPRREARRRAAPHRMGLQGVVTAALGWVAGAAARLCQPVLTRTASPGRRSRRSGRSSRARSSRMSS